MEENLEKLINDLISSDEDKKMLSGMCYYKSFAKKNSYLKGIYEIKQSIGIDINNTDIYGMKKLLSNLEKNDDNQIIVVNVFLGEENNTGSCAVFTDESYSMCYGVIKALQ